jgi:hypothetical protein
MVQTMYQNKTFQDQDPEILKFLICLQRKI